MKNAFFKVYENSQENTWVGVSFFNKTTGWRPATLWKRGSGSDVLMWIFTIFENIYFVNGLLKQHEPKYALVFFGIHVLQEHRQCFWGFQLTQHLAWPCIS